MNTERSEENGKETREQREVEQDKANEYLNCCGDPCFYDDHEEDEETCRENPSDSESMKESRWCQFGLNTWYSKDLGQIIITKDDEVISSQIEADGQHSPHYHWVDVLLKKTRSEAESIAFVQDYIKRNT